MNVSVSVSPLQSTWALLSANYFFSPKKVTFTSTFSHTPHAQQSTSLKFMLLRCLEVALALGLLLLICTQRGSKRIKVKHCCIRLALFVCAC